MKTNIAILLLAAVGAIKVNIDIHTDADMVTDSDKHAKTLNMQAVRAELEKGHNVAPEDIISWQFYERLDSLKDDHKIWDMIRKAKKQPANVSTIAWNAVPDDILQKMVETGYMPHKGIAKKVHSFGAWLPKHAPELTQKYMPNGTEFHFLQQATPEMDENIQMISQALEKIGIPGAYKAFKMLRPYSYKSDLFRMMNLWYYGGVYMDAKLGFDAPVESWIDFDHDEFLICPDRLGTLSCPMVAMTQYHPYGALAAKMLIERVENRTYFDDPFQLTGPGVWRDVSNGTGMVSSYNTPCWVKYPGNAGLDAYLITDKDDLTNATQQQLEGADKNFRIIKTNPYGEDVWAKMKECKTCNEYKKLNADRQTYCDQPGTPCEGKDFMQWQDENSKNHNKTGGAINLVDEQKTNTAYKANTTAVAQYWDQTLTNEEKKYYELFHKIKNEAISPWYWTITQKWHQKPDYSLWKDHDKLVCDQVGTCHNP